MQVMEKELQKLRQQISSTSNMLISIMVIELCEFNLKKNMDQMYIYEFSDIWYTIYFDMFRPVKS